VVHMGTWRVEGYLAVSRSIGDVYLKRWVIPDPEIKHWNVTNEDTLLVLATDGVWDVLTNRAVAELCAKTLRQLQGSMKHKLEILARRITRKAYSIGSVDNITTLVLDLTEYSK